MGKKIRVSKVNIYFDRNSLIIKISGIMKSGTLNLIMKQLTVANKRHEYTITDIILDLSDVYPISSAAVVGLVCLCSALMTNKMKEIASPLNFYLRRPSESVLTYLATLCFFTQMSNKANLLGCEDLVRFEDKREQRSRKKQKSVSFDSHFDDDGKPIILPIKTIPCKGDSINDQDFENACQYFVNEVYDTFKRLFFSSHFNFSEGALREFCSANGELFVNIFEHSNSWGLGAIHANPARGTTVCYHDVGVCIKASVNSSPKAGREFEKFETDHEAMKWALKEGNSSKLSGNGRGLTVVEEFVLEKNGTIEMRSGCCLLRKKPGDQPGDENWRALNVPWFPGTQINFFIPCATATINNRG